ncbi:37040_t:CDS:1, partial [Racocetra persica]
MTRSRYKNKSRSRSRYNYRSSSYQSCYKSRHDSISNWSESHHSRSKSPYFKYNRFESYHLRSE